MQKKGFLVGIITGDALSAPFDGLSPGHIKTNFPNISSYTDTIKALKNNTHKWKKSATYYSLSQLVIISSISALNRRISANDFIKNIYDDRVIESSNTSFLRSTDYLTEFIFDNKSNFKAENIPSLALPIISASIALFYPSKSNDIEEKIFEFNTGLTHNIDTIIHSMIFSRLATEIDQNNDFAKSLKQAVNFTKTFISNNQPELFKSGFNPDIFNEHYNFLEQLYDRIIVNPDDSESIIIEEVNNISKNYIKRVSVNDINALIPYSISFFLQKDLSQINLYKLIYTGGCINSIAVYFNAINGLIYGENSIPEILKQDLTNKKMIFKLVEKISDDKATMKDIDEFKNSEIMLTQKYLEEYHAKNKKQNTQNPGKNKKIKKLTREEQLSKHVVESWTKIDKAKYKKEKQRNKTDED